MVNFEKKLSEWFKLVERGEEEVARKKAGGQPAPKEPEPEFVLRPEPRAVGIESTAKEASESAVATATETRKTAADLDFVEAREATGDARPVARSPQPPPALFEDSDTSQVDDFLSFLSRSSSRESAVSQQEEKPFRIPDDQGTLTFEEGTGVPRPIIAEPKQEEPASVEQAVVAEPPRAQSSPPAAVMPQTPKVPQQAPSTASFEQPSPAKATETPEPVPARTPSAEEKWNRLPHHLQTLFEGQVEEVAQHSYKSFRETRVQLIERLLDPIISLEEAARILNVCPTTVRRYTNRGVLACLRTAGNQRRFKLSDVLSFMEAQARRGSKAAADNGARTQTPANSD